MLIAAFVLTSILAIVAMLAIGAFVPGSGRRALLLFLLLAIYAGAAVPMALSLDRAA